MTQTRLEDGLLKDFVIVIDTRESEPFKFKGRNVVFDKLDVGDYSVKGFESEIAIERKSHGDFLGSITHRRECFMAEMKAMSSYKSKALVVEAEYGTLVRGHYQFARVNPETSIGTIVALVADWSIPVITAANRLYAEAFTLRMLLRYFMKVRGIK